MSIMNVVGAVLIKNNKFLLPKKVNLKNFPINMNFQVAK